MKSFQLVLLAILAFPSPAAFSRELLYDGLDNVARMQRNVRDALEVNRTPLFDNAPFLRLRKGRLR